MAKNTICVNANTAWLMNWLANDSVSELVGYVMATQGVDEKTAIARLDAIIHGDEKDYDRFIRSPCWQQSDEDIFGEIEEDTD